MHYNGSARKLLSVASDFRTPVAGLSPCHEVHAGFHLQFHELRSHKLWFRKYTAHSEVAEAQSFCYPLVYMTRPLALSIHQKILGVKILYEH